MNRRNEFLSRLGMTAFAGIGLLAGCIPNPPSGNDNNDDNDNTQPEPRPVITTYAGAGVAGLGDDGQPVLESPLYLPQDITFAPDGTLYVLDWNNHRIRRVTAAGTFETVVGTGELGDAQDGYAASAQLNHPTNVAFDQQGRMLVAAWHNSKIKRVDLETGLMENIAGTGGRSFGGDGGPATAAILDLPSSVQVTAAGEIVFSDQANYRIRMVDTTGTISTICGVGTPGYTGDGGPAEMAALNSPKGQAAQPAGRIDLDDNDRIFIADTSNHVIRRVDNDGTITTIAGNATLGAGYSGDGGPATDAQLNTPSDVEVAADGSVFIADTVNNVVRKVSPDGIITTVAGNGTLGFAGDGEAAEDALLNRPYGVTVAPNGDLYIADTHNHRIRRVTSVLPDDFDPNAGGDFPEVPVINCTDEIGSICTYAGTGQTGYGGENKDRLQTVMYWPFDIEFTPSGRTYVLDWNNHRVREIGTDGKVNTVVGSDDLGDGPFDLSDLTEPGAIGTTVNLNHPTDIFEFPDGDMGFVAWHNHKIRSYDPNTKRVLVVGGRNAAFEGDNGPFKDSRINQAVHGAFDSQGNFFLLDQRNQRIRVIRDFATLRGDGTIYTVFGSGTAGNVDGATLLESQVSFPTGGNPEPSGGLAIDANDSIYFADTNNHRIRRIDFTDSEFTTGTVTTVVGTGTAGFNGDGVGVATQINRPGDLEVGPDGNLYFADTNNNLVRMLNVNTGEVTTIAGTGTEGYSGDGGQASTAQLNRPFGVAFDANGDLYISDTFNSRVRKVKLALIAE